MNLETFVDKTSEASILLKLLANQKRLLILCKLSEKQETSVNDLSKFVGLSQSALSQHLAKMRDQKIIASSRKAQTVYYRIDDADVAKIMVTLQEIYC